ncbi:thioredoxin domain-containing protein [Streptomyces uncialis]|uniref:DsbA family protein n=1 Tax=Streptomyces uncialis TaxID=1048205 RepID=UPI00386F477A|nr:thioredoxin domain-containing protein [Streptomyces uncialis]
MPSQTPDPTGPSPEPSDTPTDPTAPVTPDPVPVTAPRSSPAVPPDATRRRKAAAFLVLALGLGTAAFALSLGGEESDRDRSGARSAPSAPAAAGSVEPVEPDPRNTELLGLARRDADDRLAIGRVDAPVVMIEYSDFQCPFCREFARGTEPGLISRYVDKGLLRIEWRNFPLFGEESERAARAAWAAGQQGKFWEFHDTAFGEERPRNQGAYGRGKVIAMAKEAGVPDAARFARDLDSPGAKRAVERDKEEGYALGVSSTPAFLVNDIPVLGAQPAESFEQAVEKALDAARAAAGPTPSGATTERESTGR